jgi:hypothetical protein
MQVGLAGTVPFLSVACCSNDLGGWALGLSEMSPLGYARNVRHVGLGLTPLSKKTL